MNPRLRPDYLDPFINVARLICRADPPIWLAEQLWHWNRWLYRDRRVEEIRPTREQMRSALLEVEDAALLLTEALTPSWVREFLDAWSRGSSADPERLIRALEEVQEKPDRTPHTLCAIMIWEAWKHVHKTEPAPKNRQAALAAEAYWRAAGGEGHHFGKDPLAFWRHHFKKAAASGEEDFRAGEFFSILSELNLPHVTRRRCVAKVRRACAERRGNAVQ
jgi:hypothetical protein